MSTAVRFPAPRIPVLLTAALLVSGTASTAVAASPAAIGMVTASGHFTLEGSRIWGNSTLFAGATVETDQASSMLALRNGVRVELAAGSRARVWGDRLSLERGLGQVTATQDFSIDAGGIRISADGGRFRVGLDRAVVVASLAGTTRVVGERGRLLAAIPAGVNRSFALRQAITRFGCLLYKDTGFLLDVDDSPEVFELRGPDLAENVGNRVEVSGSIAATPATIAPAESAIDVTAIAPGTQGGCITVAQALNAQVAAPQSGAAAVAQPAAGPAPPTPAPEAAEAGLSTGAKVGIAAAVAGGGAGAAIALTGKKTSTSP